MITKAPLISYHDGTWSVHHKADLDLDPEDLYVWWANAQTGVGSANHFKVLFEHLIREVGYPILVRYKTNKFNKEDDGLFLVENDTDAIQAILSYGDMLAGEGS
jgi:hypothetical protein